MNIFLPSLVFFQSISLLLPLSLGILINSIKIIKMVLDISVAHSFSIKRKNLPFNASNFSLIFRDDLRLKLSISISRNSKSILPYSLLTVFLECPFLALEVVLSFIECLAYPMLNFSFKHSLNSTRKQILKHILNIISIFNIVILNQCFKNFVVNFLFSYNKNLQILYSYFTIYYLEVCTKIFTHPLVYTRFWTLSLKLFSIYLNFL